jgi:hypothetical protein
MMPCFDETKSLQTGISANNLRNIFPYHIVINQSLIITQVGNSLKSIFPSKNSNQSSLIHRYIDKCFKISSPHRASWEWNQIIQFQSISWDLDLADSDILNEGRETRENLNKLPLRGCLLLLDPLTDPFVSEHSVIFLCNLRLTSAEQMRNYGFTPNDLSKFSLQREYILAG